MDQESREGEPNEVMGISPEQIKHYSEVPSELRHTLADAEKIEDFVTDDFDLDREIAEREGTTLEIGGPSEEYYLEELDKLKKVISNIELGTSLYDPDTGEFLGYHGKVDMMADGRNIPIREKSVGILLCSYLDYKIIGGMIEEAGRVLEKKGLLVIQAGSLFIRRHSKLLKRLGFRKMQTRKAYYDDGGDVECGIFQKIK